MIVDLWFHHVVFGEVCTLDMYKEILQLRKCLSCGAYDS